MHLPIFFIIATLAISCLSFLQISNNSDVVLQWCVVKLLSCLAIDESLAASQLLNHAIISWTYLRFYYVSVEL